MTSQASTHKFLLDVGLFKLAGVTSCYLSVVLALYKGNYSKFRFFDIITLCDDFPICCYCRSQTFSKFKTDVERVTFVYEAPGQDHIVQVKEDFFKFCFCYITQCMYSTLSPILA